jgi:hypothetical protein
MRRLSLLIFCLIAPIAAHAECGAGKSVLLLEYVSTPPLLAAEPDASTIVQIDADGCAMVHVPAYRLEHGDYRLQLESIELTELRADLDATNLRGIDPGALGRRIQAKSMQQRAQGLRVAIRDENLIQFRVPATKSGRAAALGLTGLRQALANALHDDQLLRLSRLQARLEAIAEQVQRHGDKVSP